MGKVTSSTRRGEDVMPLVRIDLRKGKDAAYREQIRRAVHEAMASVGAPANDQFEIVEEHGADELLFDPADLGINRSDGLVIIQIALNEGRTIILRQGRSEVR